MSQPSELTAQQDDDARRLERALADLRALAQVIIEISRSLDLDNVLESSLEGIKQVVGGDFGCFLLIRPGANTLQLAKVDALPSSLRAGLEQLTLDQELLTLVSHAATYLGVISTIDQRVSQVLKAQGIDSFVQIPLTAESHAIGTLLVVTRKSKILEPRSVDLLRSIGEQVGMAIENARRHAAVLESAEWHRAFMENSLDAFWEVDSSGRITYVNGAACRLLGYDREALLRMRPSDFTVDDLKTQQASSQELRREGLLINRDATIRTCSGEIRAVNYSTRVVRDGQGNIVRFQSISRDVTARRNLLKTLQHRNEELAALNNIASILSHPLDIARSLDLVCGQITSITGMEGAALYLVDEPQSFLNLLASRGLSENLVKQGIHLGLDDHLTRRIAIEGEPIAFDDMMLYAEPSLAGPRKEGYHAGIAVPILKQGTPIGAIFVGAKNRFDYERSDIDLLLNVGKQIGQAIENADLYAQMQRRMRELDGLAQLSAACTMSLDPQTVADITIDWTRKLLSTSFCALRLFERNRMRLVSGYTEMGIKLQEYLELADARQVIVENRLHYVVNDLETDGGMPEGYLRELRRLGLWSFLAVPLPTPDRVIGVLAIGHSEPHVWLDKELDLLKTIANQAANAVNNAQLFQNVLSEQRKVEAIFDSGLSGLYATDAAGHIVMFNRAAERVTGWTLREVEGRSWQEVFDDPEPLIEMALHRKESAYDPEGRVLKTCDGRMIPVAEAVAPLFDERGDVNGAVGAFWDLSKEKQAEWSREHFLTMVAHQLRSPLSVVLSALQLLERQNLSTARRAELWLVVKSDGARLKKFADEFLDLESAVRSPRPVQFEPLSIVTLARHLTHEFKGDYRGHHFRVKSSKPELIVFADSVRAENVLRNLLDNAVRYSPAKSLITISIKTRQDVVDISVRDQGQGIPAEDRERIFEPFYRSSKLAGQPSDGHGLGLFIARNMVNEMDGEIWLDPEQGRGTTFHFTLRRYK